MANHKGTGYTDNIYQVYRVYIEGVQVPFDNITISQGIGALPSATISVPALAGLMDISRFYQPKVHIFYEDQTAFNETPVSSRTNIKDFTRLLFQGLITGVSYSKSRNGSGGISIQFSCAHRNSILNKFLIDYSGFLDDPNAPKGEGVMGATHPNSQAAINEALQGIITTYNPNAAISPTNPTGDITLLTDLLYKHYHKLTGMPGIIVNYWHQLKRDAYNESVAEIQDVFTKLYEPLVEDGIKFFERLSGHFELEQHVDAGKVDPCPSTTGTSKPIIVPPCNKVMIMAAAQTAVTIGLLNNYMQSHGEITNIYTMMREIYASMDYEMLTLASPAEAPIPQEVGDAIKFNTKAPVENTTAIETIVKPVLPFYYAPMCNVLLPQMYHSLTVQYDTENVPTRLTVTNQEFQAGPTNLTVTRFRAPASIRKAIADKSPGISTLESTLGFSKGAVGKYEYGMGILPMNSQMPQWLGYLSSTFRASENQVKDGAKVDTEEDRYMLGELSAGWLARYPKYEFLNPYAEDGVTMAHQRIMFSSADYMYAEQFARTRGGTVQCPFNPYIVPGYPMDIIDPSPTLPSFHAMCMTVTHNISGSSASTSVSFTAAITYSELVNYYIPFMHPFLQAALGLARNPTLVNNTPEAITIADDFYLYTLGTTCAPPEMLYNFSSTAPGLKPLIKDANNRVTNTGASTSSMLDTNGGEMNPNMTYQGNLSLVFRPIESQSKIESRFGLKFIDMTYDNYSPTVIKYKDKVLASADKLDIGANQFLQYTIGGEDPDGVYSYFH